MNILYYGSICNEKWINNILKNSNTPFTIAQHMLETSIVSELKKENKIHLNYIHRDIYYPKNKLLIFTSKKDCVDELTVKNIFFINIPLIKEFFMFFGGVLRTLLWGIKYYKDKNKIILLAIQYPPVAFAVSIISKLLNIKRVLIITDIAQSTYNTDRVPTYKRILFKQYKNLVLHLQQNYDGYVFLSEPMNKLINEFNKPYVVMEGIFNPKNLDFSISQKEKAIMHAGTLSFRVGVKKIIDIFMSIDDPELELWLFGDGDLKSYILEMQEIDKRIKYFGFRDRMEVFEYQKKSSLLINLRNPEDFYTKYSFPSKTFEYMVSGTPFLTTVLDCIPEEYYPHLILAHEYDDIKIKKIITDSLKNKEQLINKGVNARNFILKEKNACVQTKKINELLKIVSE